MIAHLASGGRWRLIFAAGVGFAGLAAVVVTELEGPMPGAPAFALINESPSLPRGLYVRRLGAEPRRGEIVALPQPAVAQPYLRGLGMPSEVLLIKRVGAVQGDEVCASGGRVTTPGRVVAVGRRDGRGVRLPVWRGCRRLARDELFLLGDTPSSFDSRYFGPVRRADVAGVYGEMLTWRG